MTCDFARVTKRLSYPRGADISQSLIGPPVKLESCPETGAGADMRPMSRCDGSMRGHRG
jgi:hypothetical protein